jgi:hypothetical protein
MAVVGWIPATAIAVTEPEHPAPLLAKPHTPIRLDGDLADWRDVPFTEVTPQNGVFDAESPSTDDPANLSYRFAVCHDDEALYVAVEVTDDKIVADDCKPDDVHAPAWMDDAVEVFIDGNHNRAEDARPADGAEQIFGGEFSQVINGAATSRFSGYPRTFGQPEFWQGVTNWKAVQAGEKKLRYEFRILWRAMGGKVRPGDTIGFNIALQDDDDGGKREHSLYWRGISPHCWKNEGGWGEILMEREK